MSLQICLLHNKLTQERWTHHIYKNKRGRVHTSFSHLNKSIIYRHYGLSLARLNDVYDNKSVRALDLAGICKHSTLEWIQSNMGSKLNKQSCIWEPLSIFNMVFSTPQRKEKKIKLFTRESSQQIRRRTRNLFGFSF